MTGLKSGAGDDLWDDDEEDDADEQVDTQDSQNTQDAEQDDATETGEMSEADRQPTDADTKSTEPQDDEATSTDSERTDTEAVAVESQEQPPQQPYIVRRAIEDKSVQFERDDRLTFFVHDDVVEGERELLMEAEAALGRDVPKFDVREAVYRAALRNKEDVIAELVRMGYSTSE